MARIDDPVVYNPFGWRLADLADPRLTGEHRERLLEELLVWEAEEAAHGYRHLTVSHGDPPDLEASRHLSGFYETLRGLAAGCEWVRVRGDIEYVTITVRGADADGRIEQFAQAARSADPGCWRVVMSACPPVT